MQCLCQDCQACQLPGSQLDGCAFRSRMGKWGFLQWSHQSLRGRGSVNA